MQPSVCLISEMIFCARSLMVGHLIKPFSPFIILISMQNFQVCYYFEWGPLVLIFPHLSPVAGMKYDLRRVEEVYYDVKIRGLAVTGDAIGERGIEGQS